MASIRFKFRPSQRQEKEGVIYLQIIEGRAIFRVNTGIRIHKDEWDDEHSHLRVAAIDSERLSSLQTDMEWELHKFRGLLGVCEDVKKAISLYHGEGNDGQGVFDFIHQRVMRLKSLGRTRSSETMASSLRSFMRFRGYVDLCLTGFNKDVVEHYQAWLKSTGVRRNTSSFYMRNLHTAYNAAIEAGLVVDGNPFRRVYTGVDKTAKRAISKDELKKIKNLDLTNRPALAFARDMFLFSFYTRGMSFVDMAYLRKSDLKDGTINYCRKKTGQQITIEWVAEMQAIIDRNRSATPYLLPIITTEDESARAQYQNCMTRINRHLKTIGKMANISIPLSTYVSRHSWATIARTQRIPISIISKGLGHDNEHTTQIYLDTIKSSLVDRANRQIIKGL